MRLIDADTLIREMHNVILEDGEDRRTFYEVIERQPTIEPEPHWIPCSERLPEEEDYRECMECLDGAVWYYTDRKTMGLGYYYDSTKQWSTICDIKPDGNVIAWMPLPKAYREDES